MKRKFTNDFLIDGAPMLAPDQDVIFDEYDLLSDASGRDESGVYHTDVLQKGLKTFGFTYSILTAEEYKYVKSQIKGKQYISFTFYDENGNQQTISAYIKQTSVVYWSARRRLFKDFKFEVIQR